MADAARELADLVAAELFRTPPEGAERLTRSIRKRLEPRLAAVVFYGSCLRCGSAEGVHDFYAVVDDYRGLYGSRPLEWANALLPPNVFYVEAQGSEAAEVLRAKYAVLSARDLARATGPAVLRPSIWARFCQPALAVWTRDREARDLLVRAAAESLVTALRRLLPLLPARGSSPGFSSPEFWHVAFRETYASEMRPETPEGIRAVYEAAPQRFDRAAELALRVLEERGWLRLEATGASAGPPGPAAQPGRRVQLESARRRRGRLAWRLRQPLAKAVYAANLLKSAATFGDWLPYVLWKLERHSGTRLEPSPRQRRHPLIFGWPLLLRVLWRRDLR